MIFGVVLAGIYCAIAAVAVVMTLVEQRRRRKGVLLRIAGLGLSLLWPVTVVAMALFIYWPKIAGRPQGPDHRAPVAAVKAH